MFGGRRPGKWSRRSLRARNGSTPNTRYLRSTPLARPASRKAQYSSAGYLLGTITSMNWIFDYKPNDIFWCTADVGWVTGHSYVTYGPLAVGATQVIFEGVPTYPDAGRFWRMIPGSQSHHVLYRAHRYPIADQAGCRPAGKNTISPRGCRFGWRADQPGSMDVVLHRRLVNPAVRWWIPGGRLKRAVRLTRPGGGTAQAGVLHFAAPRHHGLNRG